MGMAWLDGLPLIAFYAGYQVAGLTMATIMAMAVMAAVMTWHHHRHGSIPNTSKWSFALLIVFGGLTLITHNPTFIIWKPTLLYWGMGLWLLAEKQLRGKNWLQETLPWSLTQPEWHRMLLCCVGFTTLMGVLNLMVAHWASISTWVTFKLFGTLALTLIFVLMLTFFFQPEDARHERSIDHA